MRRTPPEQVAGMLSMPEKAVMRIRQVFRSRRERRRSAATAYADPAWVAHQLARQASFSALYDAKTCGALFLASYAPRIAMKVAKLWVGKNMLPDMSLDRVWVREVLRLHFHHGRPELDRRLEIELDKGASVATSDDSLVRLRSGIESHFHPLIVALCDQTGISHQALWRLVGDAISAAFLEAGRKAGREEAAKADALTLLKQVGSPLHNAQMHYFRLAIADPVRTGRTFSRTFRQRGGCCRYYTAFPGQLCSTCVLKDPVERDRALEARMLRHLTLRRFPERLYRNAKARLSRYLHPGSGSSSGGMRGPSA